MIIKSDHYWWYGLAATAASVAFTMLVLVLNGVEDARWSVCLGIAAVAVALAAIGRYEQKRSRQATLADD